MSDILLKYQNIPLKVAGIGTLRLLEAIRFLKLKKQNFIRQVHQNFLVREMVTSHLMKNLSLFLNLHMVFLRFYSYWMTKLYREAYGIYACNGILFNHESPRRGETFVTRKITMFLAKKF